MTTQEELDAMADFLLSIGYVESSDGRWQDRRQYEPPKTLEDAYKFEMELFQ